jgi:tRNA G37 N-methylase Trm5
MSFAPMPQALLRTHLTVAHHYWKLLVKPGDTVIDATCGNGHDALYMAQLALMENSGAVFGFDIQAEAIEKTRLHLQANLPEAFFNRVTLFHRSHNSFPEEILPKSVKLIVYNLGYLPGGDKTITTLTESSLESIKQAQELLSEDGVISVTCYPGHPEGKIEEEAIFKYASSLNPRAWTCVQHNWINRQQAPRLLMLCRSLQ